MKKIVSLMMLAPLAVFAQGGENLGTLIERFSKLLNQVAPLLLAMAFVYFLWNIVKYIEAGGGDAKARDAARDNIIYAIILLFVMVSVWGLVGIVKNTVGIDNPTAPTITLPTVPESTI